MALIYRSLLELDAPNLADEAPVLFATWLRGKSRLDVLRLPDSGETAEIDGLGEVTSLSGGDEGCSGFRGTLFEDRSGEQVRTMFTAMTSPRGNWVWIDLERWSEDAYAPTWVPFAPFLVRSLLRDHACWRGSTSLSDQPVYVGTEEAELLTDSVLDPDRELPVLVVSPTRDERETGSDQPNTRAFKLMRHLAGVATVAVLGPGGTGAFSKRLTDIGPGLDVHSGAVRTYRPVGERQDLSPRRHPFVTFRRIAEKPPEVAARMLAAPLLRSGTAQSPPQLWRTRIRSLPGFPGAAGSDPELEELYNSTDEQRRELESKVEPLRESIDDLLRKNGDLARRLKWALEKVRQVEPTAVAIPPTPAFEPEFCEEVVRQASEELRLVVMGPDVADAAEDLDQHLAVSWAKKGWLALQAFQAYAEAQATGGAGGDFRLWCQTSGHPDVIPVGQVSMSESEGTDESARFRGLRTFSVSTAVEASGQLYMPAHIKIEPGGYPAPRIYFHDDTRGSTAQVHVGWFGDHRDNRSTN